MSQRDLRSYFDARACVYENGNWQGRDLTSDELFAIDCLPGGLDVAVDLGSGPGRPMAALAERARTVVAIDISREMLRLRRHSHPAVVADGNGLPIRDHKVDVFCMRMSMHYFSLAALRTELARALKKEGWLVIISVVPYGRSDEAWFNERHQLKGKSAAHTPPVGAIVDTLRPSFELAVSRCWTAVQPVRSSLRSHPLGAKEQLIEHALAAPSWIRDLYRVTADSSGEISMTVKWAALVFRTIVE